MSGEAERARAAAVARINAVDRDHLAAETDRRAFFETVYETADGDPAGVPWADLEPKPELVEWLAANPGAGKPAIDVACGLGDNAEAISAAGYAVTAFDGSRKAIDWARRRFQDSPVDYHVADLLNPPAGWLAGFDLVHECYTIQSVPPERHQAFVEAVASLVAPGGVLLVYARTRDEEAGTSGPPWPLPPSVYNAFSLFGLELQRSLPFTIERPDRSIPHLFAEWRRPAATFDDKA